VTLWVGAPKLWQSSTTWLNMAKARESHERGPAAESHAPFIFLKILKKTKRYTVFLRCGLALDLRAGAA